MNQPKKPPGYSLRWALDIVLAFNYVYPRATESAKRLYGFSDENVAEWVANNQARWRRYKSVCKQVGRWERFQDNLGIPYEVLDGCVVDAVEKLKKYGNLE